MSLDRELRGVAGSILEVWHSRRHETFLHFLLTAGGSD